MKLTHGVRNNNSQSCIFNWIVRVKIRKQCCCSFNGHFLHTVMRKLGY